VKLKYADWRRDLKHMWSRRREDCSPSNVSSIISLLPVIHCAYIFLDCLLGFDICESGANCRLPEFFYVQHGRSHQDRDFVHDRQRRSHNTLPRLCAVRIRRRNLLRLVLRSSTAIRNMESCALSSLLFAAATPAGAKGDHRALNASEVLLTDLKPGWNFLQWPLL
jgi:hypothetical protein